MADDLDAELLALAGDASGDEGEARSGTGSLSPRSRSGTPRSRSGSPRSRSQTPRSRSGTPRSGRGSPRSPHDRPASPKSAPRSPEMSPRRAATPPKKGAARSRRTEPEEDGEVSGADSMGSGAMSESDSESDGEAPAPHSATPAAADADTPFPVEGRFHSSRDKAEIMNLPEIEREQILAERAAEAERQAQTAQLRSLYSRQAKPGETVKKRKAGSVEELEDSPRKASRAKTKTAENLEAYKKQRQQMNETRERNDQLRARGELPDRRRESSPEDGQESELEYDDPRPAARREEVPATLQDFQRVKVSRSNFAQYWAYPRFNERMAGCFARLCTGKINNQPVYRMVQIKRFEDGRQYTLDGPNGKKVTTPVHAVTSHGKQEQTHDFSRCSNDKITEYEFETYKQALREDNLKLPTKAFLTAKIEDINKIITHHFTSTELQEKITKTGVENRKFAPQRHLLLQKQLEYARDREDDVAIAKAEEALASFLKANPQAAPSPIPPPTSSVQSQQDRLAKINLANRAANIENIRRAQLEERRAERRHAAAVARGQAEANPFARVKIATKTYHDVEDGKKKEIDELFGDSGAEGSRAGTPKPGGGAAKGKKRMMDEEVISAMDMGIDIEI